jgi:glyoxylase-like metal-dependent hydrolase (beta-lactamase superfamily II)
MYPSPQQSSPAVKPPRAVLPEEVATAENVAANFPHQTILAFPPNRDTLGGTSYFIVRNEGNILIDCPALDATNQNFLQQHGGVRWLFLTHRGAIGKTAEFQKIFNCEIIMQEQEAYLLPGVTVTTFSQEYALDDMLQAIWTPGHSPGSCCLYYREFGGVLFSGRHLLPNLQGQPVPLRTAKTFHWPRQINSIQLLCDRFSLETLHYICPGANTGYLRGKRLIDGAYQHLINLDLQKLLVTEAIL